MQKFTLSASDGKTVQCYKWIAVDPAATIHIAHGMGEHAQRYDPIAKFLASAGYSVYATDHRGHGLTATLQSASASIPNYGYFGGDGWNRVLADTYELNRLIRRENESLPCLLLGHSMGSMMAQQYITRYGGSIDALVLSGSPGFKPRMARLLPKWIAQFESWRLGPEQSSDRLQQMLFGGSNKLFDSPDATGFEWLTSDAEEVQKYIVDEACGFVVSSGSLCDLFSGSEIAQDPACIANIPKSLPMYVFSGSEDPVHGQQQDLNRMIEAYRKAGVVQLDYKLYPGGRHEMFNETCRDQVVADLLTWIQQWLSAA